MTSRDGTIIAPSLVTELFSDEHFQVPNDGYLQVTTQAVVGNVVYKNHFNYPIGSSTFEVSITSGAPSNIPPSGHSPVDYVGFVVLQG